MKKKKIRDVPIISVPQGYDIFYLVDTDDDGYAHGEAILEEEVIIDFERNDDNEKQCL